MTSPRYEALVRDLTRRLLPPLRDEIQAAEARITAAVKRSSIPGRLLDADEVAAWLGVSERYVWRLAREDRLRCVPVGKYRRFDRADVEAFIEASKNGRRPHAHVEEPAERPGRKARKQAARRRF